MVVTKDSGGVFASYSVSGVELWILDPLLWNTGTEIRRAEEEMSAVRKNFGWN